MEPAGDRPTSRSPEAPANGGADEGAAVAPETAELS